MMHNYRPIFPASLKFCFQFTKMDLYAEFPPLLESLEKWEGTKKSHKILEKPGNFRQMLYLSFSVIFKLSFVLFAKMDRIFC